MIFKIMFVFSVFAGILNDWLVKKYLCDLNIFVYLFVLNLVSLILLTLMYTFLNWRTLFSYYMNKSYSFIFKKSIQFITYNTLALSINHESIGVSRFSLLVLLNSTFFLLQFIILFFKTKIISFSYYTVIRSIVSTGGLFLILNEFNDSEMTQLTSGYYAIPIGDFLYTSSMDGSRFVILLLGLLVGLIVGKDFIANSFDFMSYSLFNLNGSTLFFIFVLGLCWYFNRMSKVMHSSVICSISLIVYAFASGALSNSYVNVDINLLFYFISVMTILYSLYKRSKNVMPINYIIIGFNIFVLLIYKAKTMAIIGSIFLSVSDILIKKYAKDLKSELMVYSMTLMCISLPVLFIKDNYNILQLFMINSSHFPVANIRWIFVWITSFTSLIIQFAIVLCFSKHSLNAYLPFRYIDLTILSAFEGRYMLTIVPLLSSALFWYFI